MNNPYIPILKADSRATIISTVLSTVFFLALYYVIERESFIILLFMYLSVALYIIGFLNHIAKKQKMFLMLPATSKQLVQAVFYHVLYTISIFALAILPFYLLASSFDEVASPISETILLFIVLCGSTLLFAVCFVWLYFSLKERSWLTLLQFVSLFLVTIISFSLLITFERFALHAAGQIVFFVVFYSASIYFLYKRTIRDYQKFNIL